MKPVRDRKRAKVDIVIRSGWPIDNDSSPETVAILN